MRHDPRPVSLVGLPSAPDRVGAWIELDLLPAESSAGGWRRGPTPAIDEALDALIVLRAWTARRLVN